MYLITGASGFVGSQLTRCLSERGAMVRGVVRRTPFDGSANLDSVDWYAVGDISQQVDWRSALSSVKCVLHCAAIAHVELGKGLGALDAYREVNVAATLRLAQQAADAGVERFVLLSSIGVNGNQSTVPFTEASIPNPRDAYAVSKFEAEQALLALTEHTAMEVVIIRPPLVYGPRAPGNFGKLVRWVQSGLPLPLGAVNNLRSLVALDNLVSLAILCADRVQSPQAAGQTFLVCDGEDVSTSTLLRKVAKAAGRPARLIPVPAMLLRTGLGLLGKRGIAERLLGNLQVSALKAQTLLGWRPVVTMDEQLAKIFGYQN